MEKTQLALAVDTYEAGDLVVRRFTLPFLPPSKNVYDGWPNQWKSSAKKKWVRHITNHCEELNMPKGLTQVGLSAVLYFPTQSRRDPQNYSNALWHWVPDALQECGVLLDDRDGAVQIGANWGLTLKPDLRSSIPKAKRSRTQIAIAFRAQEDSPGR